MTGTALSARELDALEAELDLMLSNMELPINSRPPVVDTIALRRPTRIRREGANRLGQTLALHSRNSIRK
jgi:hypothetical protein